MRTGPSVVEPTLPTDPDDAYANAAHVADAERIVAEWPVRARAFREAMGEAGRAEGAALAHGTHPRERLDVFAPAGTPNGVAVIVHGGYWMRFAPSDFSHLAAGAVARGWVAVLPGYPLCPDASLGEIAASVGRAVGLAASLAPGPIRLAGHSAGGQLVARLACTDAPLVETVAERIDRTLSISGLHDLVPLLATGMNATLGLDEAAALAESPARLLPRAGTHACAWVGADERPEFVRQNALLGTIWNGVGARVATHVEPARHHFDVIEDLVDPDSAMVEWWLGKG